MNLSRDKKIILFGAGIVGKSALYYYGKDRVFCFADNHKAGQTFEGKKVISFEKMREIHENYEIIISASYAVSPALQKQCNDNNLQFKLVNNEIKPDRFDSCPEIAKLKNIHKGKRGFIIGNGPSLRMEDLEKLHGNNELSFASNKISRAYVQTHWRPIFYSISDPVFNNDIDTIKRTEAKVKLLPNPEQWYFGDCDEYKKNVEKGTGNVLFYNVCYGGDPQNVLFSGDVSKAICLCVTVTYVLLQIAVYVGCETIYLLGMDNTPGDIHSTADVYIKQKSHFYDETESDFEDTQKVIKSALNAEKRQVDTATAYKVANNYAKQNSIRIYNATRGGALEIFERVNYDELF
jgi:hypothetical protein